ncbi:MAG: TetR/AcrR family transcriptional regulator [Nannocystaceae bacterium]|nr:TetR/AcrR family transcriptional regulator [Nannocystaceae bacterium]
MGRPTADSIEIDTPTRVLDAAEDAFALVGLAGAKLADIAAAAGIRRPSLLYHFSTKEGLYSAVVMRGFQALGKVMQAAMASDGDFDHRLRLVLSDFVEFLDERPHLARIVCRQVVDGSSPGREILLEQVAPLLDEVVRFVEAQGGDRLRPDVSVRAVTMQVCASIMLRAASGELRAALWGTAEHDLASIHALLFSDTHRVASS